MSPKNEAGEDIERGEEAEAVEEDVVGRGERALTPTLRLGVVRRAEEEEEEEVFEKEKDGRNSTPLRAVSTRWKNGTEVRGCSRAWLWR